MSKDFFLASRSVYWGFRTFPEVAPTLPEKKGQEVDGYDDDADDVGGGYDADYNHNDKTMKFICLVIINFNI